MRLLSQQQVKQNKESELAKEALRIAETQKLSKKSREELAKTQAEFYNTLAKNRELWANEAEEHQRIVKEMKKEVEELQKKKEQALIPIKIYKDEVDRKMDVATILMEKAKQQKQENDALEEILEDRLDEVGQREQDVKLKEQKLLSQIQANEQQANFVIQGQKSLNQEIKEFVKQREQAFKDIDKRMTAVLLKEHTLEERMDSLKRTEETLCILAKQLEDRRGILDRREKREKL